MRLMRNKVLVLDQSAARAHASVPHVLSTYGQSRKGLQEPLFPAAAACDVHAVPSQGYVEPPEGPAPPATLASAQRLAAQLVSSPTRVLLLKNMLRAGQLRDDEERKDVRARSMCRAPSS